MRSNHLDHAHDVLNANLRRVNGIINAVHSDPALRPAALFGNEGPGADILRSAIVFLHATLEVYLRALSHAKQGKTFNHCSEIKQALVRAQINVAPFTPLWPPLNAFLERRHKIVHRADLASAETTPPGWSMVDGGQLVIWLCAVAAFACQVRIATSKAQVARDASTITYRQYMQGIDSILSIFKQALALGQSSPDTKLEAFQKLCAAFDATTEVLSRDPLSYMSEEERVRYSRNPDVP